jgi:modulator of FtsH protease HflC
VNVVRSRNASYRKGTARPPEFAAIVCANLNKIQSEAYRQVEEIRGAADAKATEIYAKAYNQSPEAVAFYEFTRTMQAYKSIIAENTTLVLSTDSDLFKFLKGLTPKGGIVPAQRSGDTR